MKTMMTMAALRCAVATTAALGALAGCGGGGDADSEAAGLSQPLAAGAVQPTLLDDEGRPNLNTPAVRPQPAHGQTQAGRYASTAQAAALGRAVGAKALQVAVGCCGDRDVDAAVESAAQALQAAPDPTALLVGGEELGRAIAAADRLEALAAGRVWLVTP